MDRTTWLCSYQNDKTKKQAVCAISCFDKFLKDNNTTEELFFDNLKQKKDTNEKYIQVQKFINYKVTNKASPNSIRNYWVFIKNWFWFNGVTFAQEEIKAFLKFPRPMKDLKEPMTREVVKLIIDNAEEPYKTCFLILASSGMRLHEALSISINSIDWGEPPLKPTAILLSPEITKYSTGRQVYISRQASEHLERYLDDYLKLKQPTVEEYFSRLRKKLGLTERYSNGRNFKIHIHAFKSFFMSEASLVHDYKYSHALGGHTEYLPEYFRTTRDKRDQMYLELEPIVTF